MKKIFAFLAVICSALSIFLSPTASAQDNRVQVVYFWGAECPHCAHLKPWLDLFEKTHADTVKIDRYEFWHDEGNAKMFMRTMKMYGIPDNEAGAPAAVVNNKVLIGTKDIQEQLEHEVNAVLEARKNGEGDSALAGLLTGVAGPVNKDCPVEKGTTSFGAVTMTALADSVNPCAMMVLIILMSSLVVTQKSKAKVALTAATFILAVFLTYFLIGFGLSHIIASTSIANWIVVAVGGMAIVIGLANLKDAFWYRKGNWAMEIPMAWRNKLNKVIMSATSPVGAFIAGIIVTMFELPCTGGPYLFGLSLISLTDSAVERMRWLAYYNLIFIAPLLVIAVAVLVGKTTIERAEEWRNKHAKLMHFIVGVIMLTLGIWALFLR